MRGIVAMVVISVVIATFFMQRELNPAQELLENNLLQ